MPGALERVTTAVARARQEVDVWRARPRGVRPYVPQQPATQSMFWGGGWGDVALPVVNEAVVLGLPAAWRAVRLIAEGVASLAPPRCLQGDGVTPAVMSPICDRPNSLLGVTEFWSMAVSSVLVTGNFVGILADFDPDSGYARQCVPVNSAMVACHYDEYGWPEYEIGGLKLGPDDVVHVRHHVVAGSPWGVGPVTAHRRALGAHGDQQNFAASTYRTGLAPSGVINVARPEITTAQADDVADQFIERHGAGQRRPAVLSEMFSFTPISWSPEDAQFLQSRQFSIGEVAMMFGLDPSDLGASLGASGAMTYANLSQRFTARVVDAYGPWIRRFEDAWSDLMPGGTHMRFQTENLTNASRSDLLTELKLGIDAGIITVDEARMELHRPPLDAEPPPQEEMA